MQQHKHMPQHKQMLQHKQHKQQLLQELLEEDQDD
jgi:hypothetical protein